MLESILGIINGALSAFNNVFRSKNTEKMVAAKEIQNEVNQENVAETAILKKDEKTISNLLSD